MKKLLVTIWFASVCLFSTSVRAQESVYKQYLEHLELPSLEKEVAAKSLLLGVRLIEEGSDKVASYTVTFSKDKEVLHGELSVFTRFSGRPAPQTGNRRSLTDVEANRVLDLINRRELLFLPATFTSVARKSSPDAPMISIEIVSANPAKRVLLTRSLTESDSIQELRDWLIALAFARNGEWKIVDK